MKVTEEKSCVSCASSSPNAPCLAKLSLVIREKSCIESSFSAGTTWHAPISDHIHTIKRVNYANLTNHKSLSRTVGGFP